MSRNIELEHEMHRYFTPWVVEHTQSSGGKISDTGYDPEKFPPQRIGVATVPALIETAVMPPAYALEELRNQYAVIMGSYAAARAQINVFLEARAYEDSSELLADTVADYLEDGKSVGLITDHANGLFDMPRGQGGLSLAISESRGTQYVGSFKAWVNKLMTRQYYKRQRYGAASGRQLTEDVYIPQLLSVGGGTRLVIPDTDNARRHIPDKAIWEAVNRPALKSFIADKKAGRGTVEVMVPSGTRMEVKKDSSGRIEYLVEPAIADSSANLLAHLDAIVTFSEWAGRISLGKIIEVGFKSKPDRAEKTQQLAARIREILRQQTQAVTGIPVFLAEEIDTAA